MGDRELLLLLGGAALLLGGSAAAIALSGPKVTSSTLGPDGQIVESPDELLAQACASMGRPVSMDAYALARMAASEGANEARPRMLVALNDGAHYGWDVLKTVTYTKAPGQIGRFGRQSVGGITRRYGTSLDPTRALVELAERVIPDWEAGNDETGGAEKFYDIGSGQPGARKYEDVVAEWGTENFVPDTLPGYTDTFRIFRRA